MRRSLDKRADGYELFEVSSLDDLDLPTFLPMVDRAWRHDYVDQTRLVFDQAVLRRLTRGGGWVAVLASSADGSPVGFELALKRRLRVGEQTFSAYYATLFTVSADHRRRGLGRWILEAINQLVFAEREADLIVSTFHAGHAGSPTVDSTFGRIPGWGVARFHHTPIWSRRLDKDPLMPLTTAPRFVRLEREGAGHRVGLSQWSGGAGGDGAMEVPDAAGLDELIRSEFNASFALEASLSAQYLSPDNEASGILLYEPGPGQMVLAGFNTMPLAINERRLPPVGQLQLLLAPGCGEAPIERTVHHLGLWLAERGCFAMTLVHMGVVPPSVLDRLGFQAGEDRITFAARGPLSTIQAFEGLVPPFFLDFA